MPLPSIKSEWLAGAAMMGGKGGLFTSLMLKTVAVDHGPVFTPSDARARHHYGGSRNSGANYPGKRR